MIHIDFILYLLSFIAAASSITGATLFYFHYRKTVLIYYALMLVVPTLLMFHRITELYCKTIVHQKCDFIPVMLMIIEKSAFCLGIFVGPFFMHHLLGLSISPRLKKVYLITGVIYLLFVISELITVNHPITAIFKNLLSVPLLFGMYVYCLITAITHFRKLGSIVLKKIVFSTLVISVLILPFSIKQYYVQKPLLPGYMERPILFIVLFLFTIFFLVYYFNHPAYYSEKKLTDYFRNRFSITNREEEIITCVMQGFSNQTIGEHLSISPRTVESHLYSIFQKLGVKNRVQLINLIQTNRNS